MAQARFTWRLHVEDAENEGRGVELSGEAADVDALRHDLAVATAQALDGVDHHDVEGDEEDGWELRAAPPPAKAKPGKAAPAG